MYMLDKESKEDRINFAADHYAHMKTAGDMLKILKPDEAALAYMYAHDSAKIIEYISKEVKDKESENEWFNKRKELLKDAYPLVSSISVKARIEKRLGNIYFAEYVTKKSKRTGKNAKHHYELYVAAYEANPKEFIPDENSISIIKNRIFRLSKLFKDKKRSHKWRKNNHAIEWRSKT